MEHDVVRGYAQSAGSQSVALLLHAKLTQDVDELLAAGNVDAPDERADILEVVFAIAADLGLEPIQLEKPREARAAERGRFTERIV
jgi:predicted house-cleaning noncanonical NTP pyrophosphatase (MazG superfamily)